MTDEPIRRPAAEGYALAGPFTLEQTERFERMMPYDRGTNGLIALDYALHLLWMHRTWPGDPLSGEHEWRLEVYRRGSETAANYPG